MHPLSIDTYMVFHPDHNDIVNAQDVAPAGFVLSNRSGHQVSSFIELLKKIAKLSYHNSRFHLYFRGQSKDYSTNYRGEPISTSSLYPSILRPTGTENRKDALRKRFDKLAYAEDLLKALPISIGDLHQNQLIRWALLQHYEVTPTPLLDVTLSLQSALSFALNGSREEGYLYVLALPHPHGPLSVSLESMTQIVDLAQVCPPEALRPHFQSGQLLSDYPAVSSVELSHDGRGMRGNNFAARLLSKFRLTNCRNWEAEGFTPTPDSILYPNEADQWYREIAPIKAKLGVI